MVPETKLAPLAPGRSQLVAGSPESVITVKSVRILTKSEGAGGGMSVEELNTENEAEGINPVAQSYPVLANSLFKTVFWEC